MQIIDDGEDLLLKPEYSWLFEPGVGALLTLPGEVWHCKKRFLRSRLWTPMEPVEVAPEFFRNAKIRPKDSGYYLLPDMLDEVVPLLSLPQSGNAYLFLRDPEPTVELFEEAMSPMRGNEYAVLFWKDDKFARYVL
jgi:hypothetical protein